ncbi:MAG: SDR family oxidoreductase [Sneathiella sp.]|nr:SDR family oxidoreductase [Sneathiella sp.]
MTQSNGRNALITGANKGIGLEIARQVGKNGHHIFLGARDPDRGEAAASTLRKEGIEARFVHIDLNDPATITAAAAEIARFNDHLDVLVNNAGIGDAGDGSPGTADISVVRRIFDTNFFGSLAVAQAMLPLLRKSVSARIVNVSSGLGSLTLNSDPDWEFASFKPIGYSASKAALNMLTVHLAAALKLEGIKVNSADPGYTATDLNHYSGAQTIPEGAAAAIRLALLGDDGPTGGFFSVARPEPW